MCSFSEASASELLENLEDMFPLYYVNSECVISIFKPSTTYCCVTRRERILDLVDCAYDIVFYVLHSTWAWVYQKELTYRLQRTANSL